MVRDLNRCECPIYLRPEGVSGKAGYRRARARKADHHSGNPDDAGQHVERRLHCVQEGCSAQLGELGALRAKSMRRPRSTWPVSPSPGHAATRGMTTAWVTGRARTEQPTIDSGDRESECSSQFAGAVVDSRCDTLLLVGSRTHDRSRCRCGAQPDSAAEHQQRPGQFDVSRVKTEVIQTQEANRHGRTSRGKPQGADLVSAGTRTTTLTQSQRGDQWRQRQRSLQRGVAQHQLAVLHQEEEESEGRQEQHHDRRRTGRELGIGEQPDLEQRMAPADFDEPDTAANATPATMQL